jgi:hypothetical protein
MAAALAAALLGAGCAPLGAYRGVRPAPGALLGFAGGASPAGAAPDAVAHIEGADAARHDLGRLVRRTPRDEVVVVLYGDNRPGFRMEANSPFFHAIKHAGGGGGAFLRAIAAAPLFAVNALLPAFDGPRDLVSAFTHRPQGGAERPVLRALEREAGADLVVSMGDLVREGDRGRLWEDFVARHAALRARVPYVSAPGNHESTHAPEARRSWDEAMGPPPAPERYWWSLDVPEAGARFVFLDSNVLADPRDRFEDATEAALAEAQLAWADSALAAPCRHRFVVFHHPLVTAGNYAGDWRPGDPGAGSAQRRARLLELCARHRVTAVFAGHEHLYQRVRLVGPAGGFWHVTTGGGGSPLYSPDPAVREAAFARPWPAGLAPDPASVRAERAHHYLRLILPAGGAAGEARIEVVRVRGDRVEPLETVALGHGTPDGGTR